jgi:hypothetical protein
LHIAAYFFAKKIEYASEFQLPPTCLFITAALRFEMIFVKVEFSATGRLVCFLFHFD